jgi:hypothetical protein
MAKQDPKSRRTAYRMKPGKPAPKSSQSGYGHKGNEGGRVDPQGSGKNTAKQRSR